jgi:hypothetical protein
MKLNVAIDTGSEDATVLTREVHIATCLQDDNYQE